MSVYARNYHFRWKYLFLPKSDAIPSPLKTSAWPWGVVACIGLPFSSGTYWIRGLIILDFQAWQNESLPKSLSPGSASCDRAIHLVLCRILSCSRWLLLLSCLLFLYTVILGKIFSYQTAYRLTTGFDFRLVVNEDLIFKIRSWCKS